jgi:hypothetical protein
LIRLVSGDILGSNGWASVLVPFFLDALGTKLSACILQVFLGWTVSDTKLFAFIFIPFVDLELQLLICKHRALCCKYWDAELLVDCDE